MFVCPFEARLRVDYIEVYKMERFGLSEQQKTFDKDIDNSGR